MKAFDLRLAWIKVGAKVLFFDRGILVDLFLKTMVQLGISYFFWRSIFASGNPVISGRNFDEFVLYLVLSTYMQSMMGYPLIYFISRDIRSGGDSSFPSSS